MLNGYATAARLVDQAARPAVPRARGASDPVLSPVTPFARLARDRVEAFLGESTEAGAHGAFADYDPLGWNALLTDVPLPLIAPGNRAVVDEVDALLNGVKAILITAVAGDWPAARTRRATERLIAPALARDVDRAAQVGRVSQFKHLWDIQFAGPLVGRVIPKLIQAGVLLYVRRPGHAPEQLVAYRYRPSDQNVATLILRDVDPREGRLRDRAYDFAAFEDESTLIVYEVKFEVASTSRARATPPTDARPANDRGR